MSFWNRRLVIVIPNLQEGLHVQLTVKDTGHGIDPAIMDRIFDPFFTTKEARGGDGIGACGRSRHREGPRRGH